MLLVTILIVLFVAGLVCWGISQIPGLPAVWLRIIQIVILILVLIWILGHSLHRFNF
jgi:hypothetical protein